MPRIGREKTTATLWGLVFTVILAALIVLGSPNLDHFDAARGPRIRRKPIHLPPH